jgi:hypothetical protein
VAVLLRKCAVLAERLDNEALRAWASKELNGYPDMDEVPPYRKKKAAEVVADFAGPFGSAYKNARIPQFVVDEEDRDFLFNVVFHQPVAELENLARSESGTAQSPWPTDFVVMYGQKIYEGMVATTAARIFPVGAVVGILDAIRNKVLAFALELEKEAPRAGEDSATVEAVPEERVTQIFQTHVYQGGLANVVAAGRDATQVARQDLSKSEAARQWAARHPWLTGLILGVPGIALGAAGIYFTLVQ